MTSEQHGAGATGKERRRLPTLADVAREAGVSKPTASKALNDRADVGADTKARVMRVAAEIGFQPSAVARSLHAGRTGTVGVLTNDLEGRFVLPMLIGAEDALGSGKVSVLLCDARGDAVRERQHLATLLERRIDGLIVVGGAQTAPRASLGADLPVPVVYAYAPSQSELDVSLTPDNTQGGRIAAEHLWALGRRRIAYIGGVPGWLANQEREAGIRATLAERGAVLLSHDPGLGDWTERWGRAAAAALLDDHPEIDAIIGASDHLACAALDVLRDRGREVPRDVAVIGFDNWSTLVDNSRPELSSIDLELEGLGRQAADLIFRALDGDPIEPGVRLTDVTLASRASTLGGA